MVNAKTGLVIIGIKQVQVLIDLLLTDPCCSRSIVDCSEKRVDGCTDDIDVDACAPVQFPVRRPYADIGDSA